MIWDFIGEKISDNVIHDLQLLNEKLMSNDPLMCKLEQPLSLQELAALKKRVLSIIQDPYFPEPEKIPRPFPFPLV